MIARRFREIAGAMARKRRTLGAEEGAVLIEAALAFPILIALFLGVVEFSEAFAVSRKLSNAAATVSDLVSQMPKVSDADLSDIATVADALLAPYTAAKLGLIITSVQADNKNNTSVGWSYSHGSGATSHIDGAAFSLPAGLTEANSSVIVAETSYQFTPTIGLYLPNVMTLTGKAYFRPRATRVVMKTD
jgi:Flp pilus assembly protein TadG